MSKIVVPEGMLEAVNENVQQAPWLDDGFLLSVIEAAFRWLSENPIVPTAEQMDEICRQHSWLDRDSVRFGAREWQRRMFLAPEPEMPEEIKDLLYDPKDGPTKTGRNDAVIEAFRRGKASR